MALPYKLALIAIAAVFAGIGLGQKFEFDTHNKVTTNQQSTTLPANITDSSSETFQLQQQIRQLQAENQQLKKQLQIQHVNPPSAQPATQVNVTGDEIATRLQTLEMEKQQRKATDIINWVMQSHNADSNFDLNNELLRRFEQENRDPAWAEQQEGHYRQLFSEQSELQGIALRDTQCRSTQCEITIGISNIEQSNQLLQTISSSLAADGQPVAIMIATDESRGISRLYISNNENSFELN